MMTECPYPKGKCRIKWVTTEWLQDHLNDKKMMIVDIQPNIHDYIQEHIPGAVYMEEGCLRTFFKRRAGVWAAPEQIESASDGWVSSRNCQWSSTPVKVSTSTGGTGWSKRWRRTRWPVTAMTT